MIGILGLFNLDGRPAAAADLDTLAVAARHRATGGQRFWISSSFGLGAQVGRHGTDSAADAIPLVESTSAAAVLDGRIDNTAELTPAGHSPATCSDAACVLRAYELAGERFASRLNGDFAVAVADPDRRRLLLARDVMGPRRVHYTRVGRTLLFASEIKSLLAFPGVSASPDDDAIADIVLDRWVDGGKTGFKGIFSVPPGCTVIASADGVSVQQHWAFDLHQEIHYRRPDEYVEQFRTLFAQSVRRRMRSAQPVAVAVSGGVDSSAIFCQAVALQRKENQLPEVHGISTTFAAGGASDEQRYLDALDGPNGHRITRVPISSIGLMSHAEVHVEQTEMPALTWSPQNQLLDEARRSGCSVVLNGYFGDQVLFPRSYLVELARRGRWLRVRRHLREYRAWMTDSPEGYPQEFWNRLFRSLLPEPIFQAAKRRAGERRAKHYPKWYRDAFVRRAIERQPGRLPPLPRGTGHHAAEFHRQLTAGHYLLQLHRMTAQALTRGLDAAHPFRDRDLVAFLMAIPGEVVNDNGVPKAIVRKALSGILPDQVRNRRWKADFTAETNRAALNDFAAITELLTRSSAVVAGGYADSRVIESSLLACKKTLADNNSGEAGWDLSQLVALELWLRRFCGGQP